MPAYVHVCARLLRSYPTLCDPMDCSPPGVIKKIFYDFNLLIFVETCFVTSHIVYPGGYSCPLDKNICFLLLAEANFLHLLDPSDLIVVVQLLSCV